MDPVFPTCYHEAAHALVAVLMGFQPLEITVGRGNWHGTAAAQIAMPTDRGELPSFYRRRLIHLAAGVVGEMVCTRIAEPWDRNEALRRLKHQPSDTPLGLSDYKKMQNTADELSGL